MKLDSSTIAAIIVLALSSAAHAESIRPGMWQFTTQMNNTGMPAMPAISEAQRKQMESMGVHLPPAGGAIGINTKVCITPEQAKKGIPPNVERGGEKCEQTEVKTSGKTTSWKMACTGKQKMAGSGSVTYESPERFSGETTMNMPEGPQGPMTMNSKFSGTFLSADCKQAK